MIIVCEFPPKLSFKIIVSTDSLYGIPAVSLLLVALSILITLFKIDKEVLILAASDFLSPMASVCLSLSAPAKSTKFNFEVGHTTEPFTFCLV